MNALRLILRIAVFFFIAIPLQVQAQDVRNPDRYTLDRPDSSSQIVYYFSAPDGEQKSFPILVICQGAVESAHRSVLFYNQSFADWIEPLQVGCLTIEAWGIDGEQFNKKEFWEHYTLSQRFEDHLEVIDHFEANPPTGWNGHWIFLGYGDGGRLATDLAIDVPQTRGVVNMMGAYHSYFEKWWDFCDHLNKHYNALWITDFLFPFWASSQYLPWYRSTYTEFIENLIPSPNRFWWKLSYLYHADALSHPPVDYAKITFPYLVLIQDWNYLFSQTKAFVKAAREAGADIEVICDENVTGWVEGKGTLNLFDEAFLWIKDLIQND